MTPATEAASAADDGSVIARSLTEPSAFAPLFDRHYPSIWRYLCRRAGAAVADDLAGETFLRAFAGRASFEPSRADVRPWLYGIATNLLREQARAEVRQWRAYARAVEPGSSNGDLDGAENRLDAAALAPAVVAALALLSHPDRDALLLLALTDLDYPGIAIATGAPIGTVRSRLHRARRRMRLELGYDLVMEGSER